VTKKERRPAHNGTGIHYTTSQVDATDLNGPGRQHHNAAAPYIPSISLDDDNLTGSLAYAEAGFYLLPIKRGTKNPGSIVGRNWQSKSSRDPKVITAWFAGTDHGIALHCGRSGAVVFDVDHPEWLPDVLVPHLEAAPFQASRPDTPGRGHYIFAMPSDRTIGNSTGRLGGGWGEVRGLNGVIVVAPNGDGRRWVRVGTVPVLPDEIAELLDDASPAEDAATDTEVAAFIAEHTEASRPSILAGLVSTLLEKITDGESRHQSTIAVLAGAMKEAAAGFYSAAEAIDVLRPMFIDAVTRAPVSDQQGQARSITQAESEFRGLLAWAVGQALAADPDETRKRVEEKMPDNDANEDDDGETVQTVPWPTLSPAALHGTAGKIVKAVAPHTEADPAALLVQLLAVFGATVGPSPHIVVGNKRHRAVINPLIVGRTNNGAKGTGLDAVEAVRKCCLDWFDEFTTSGLSSAEGLIELVRDPSGDPNDDNYDPGVADKRLLVKESEYRSVLTRGRREGNTLAMTLRQAFDGDNLRTLTRKHNKLTATDPHIVVIGHITPREFGAAVDDSDLAGGSVNRLLICLSRRSRLNTRMGNIPGEVLADAGKLFDKAQKIAQDRGRLEFTEGFWERWDRVYPDLNRDRPDCGATDATARAVTMVLRLSLLYALIDGKDAIDVDHLDAALALWGYCEHSASSCGGTVLGAGTVDVALRCHHRLVSE
jgi:Bifunctional DNA primase/polymerase, N-terminal/Protein of unknown function (DUF3987)